MDNARSPVMPVMLGGFVDLALGVDHTCAALRDGGVRCWGRNERLQIGQATGATFPRPSDVAINSAIQIEAGKKFNCVLRGDGSVWCWGENNHGQLGDNTLTDRARPAPVMALGGVAVGLGCGGNQCCAVLTGGTVRCWGENASGQLGNGGTTDSGLPVTATGVTDAVQVVTAGNGHTCVRTRSGAVQCWGLNASGQLGNGTTAPSRTPVRVTF
jgi:alpha-tubulin suppressor-like RCC1 family protein